MSPGRVVLAAVSAEGRKEGRLIAAVVFAVTAATAVIVASASTAASVATAKTIVAFIATGQNSGKRVSDGDGIF